MPGRVQPPDPTDGESRGEHQRGDPSRPAVGTCLANQGPDEKHQPGDAKREPQRMVKRLWWQLISDHNERMIPPATPLRIPRNHTRAGSLYARHPRTTVRATTSTNAISTSASTHAAELVMPCSELNFAIAGPPPCC